jgi:hypothetical protein
MLASSCKSVCRHGKAWFPRYEFRKIACLWHTKIFRHIPILVKNSDKSTKIIYLKTCVRRQHVLSVRYELTPSLLLYIRDNVLRAVWTEAEDIVDDLNIFCVYEASKGKTISLTFTRKLEELPCLHVYEISTSQRGPEERLTIET